MSLMRVGGRRVAGWFLPLALASCLLHACRVNYSFTGGDPGNARTLSVELFQARAPLATPSAAQTFTETVRDLLLAQTPLKLAQTEGDVQYSGSITGTDHTALATLLNAGLVPVVAPVALGALGVRGMR